MEHGQSSGQGNDLNPPEKLQYSLDGQGNPITYMHGNPIQVAADRDPCRCLTLGLSPLSQQRGSCSSNIGKAVNPVVEDVNPELVSYYYKSQYGFLKTPSMNRYRLSREKINLIQRDHRLRAQLDELKRQHNNLDPAMRQGNEQTQLAIINLLQEIKNHHTGQQNINVMEQHHGQPIHRMQHPNVLPAQNVVDHGVMPTDRILYQGHNEGIINPTDVFPQHLHPGYVIVAGKAKSDTVEEDAAKLVVGYDGI
uniref:Uncharacterized protein n=1 Tax=Meloidogyne javanica TaxID=6303 RepID=A0A915MMQ8_MELJA